MTFNRRRFIERCGLVGLGTVAGWFAPAWFSGQQRVAAEGQAGTSPEEQLKKLGLKLPIIEPSKSLIVGAVRTGNLLFVSGHTPVADGKPILGKLGKDMEVKQGQEAARNIALRVLSVVRTELGSLDKVERLVKVLGMVNCTPEFTQQPAVINGFSEVMIEVFGEKQGKAARSAVGMSSLPGGVAVEIEAIFQVKG
jgi:enamine deaminase RidA (YjgF/YER057c/UK114 family)